MKVKNKLRIISVIGVFVVLITLIGFTFAYYKNILKGNGEKYSAYKINPTINDTPAAAIPTLNAQVENVWIALIIESTL